jgi:DNA-binding CsgD family transcriptional regulator
MNTLQIDLLPTDIFVVDERRRVHNDVSGLPQVLRNPSSCRPPTSPRGIATEPNAAAAKPALATAFLEDLRDAIVALDAQGRFLFVNRAFETMTGFDRSELLSTLMCHKIDQSQQSSWSSLARVFATPSNVADSTQVDPLVSQFRMHRADNSFFDVAVRWDRFPGSKSIAASFLLCKELMTVESELQIRMMELRVLRDELNVLLDNVTESDPVTAYSRWQAHTTQHNETVGRGTGRSELSKREQEVLHFVLDGKRVGTIAASLFLSENTVRNHLKRIYRKLGVGSLGELREHCSNV